MNYKKGQVIDIAGLPHLILEIYTTNEPSLVYKIRVKAINIITGIETSFAYRRLAI